MSFTYNPTLTSNLNELRLRLGDTNSVYPLFSDEELNAILAKTDTIEHALGTALGILSVDPVRVMASRKATSGGINLLDELNHYATRGKVYTD